MGHDLNVLIYFSVALLEPLHHVGQHGLPGKEGLAGRFNLLSLPAYGPAQVDGSQEW